MKLTYGEIRIIGGKFRGRKLKVPVLPDLRPTPDRVRETLFNWLAPVIQGTQCLDAFAGSGALGFEALSRGADCVVMVDQSPQIVRLIQEELTKFKIENALTYCASVPVGLKKPLQPFDIVFLDPPYEANLLKPTCVFLEEKKFLAAEAFIYCESREVLTQEDMPANWKILKSKKAGQVNYTLLHRTQI